MPSPKDGRRPSPLGGYQESSHRPALVRYKESPSITCRVIAGPKTDDGPIWRPPTRPTHHPRVRHLQHRALESAEGEPSSPCSVTAGGENPGNAQLHPYPIPHELRD